MHRLTTFPDFEAFLASFTNYERKRRFQYSEEALPLGRMKRFVNDIGRPQAGYPCVHIAGTKGKGSTSLMLEALLRAEGYRTGTYTSPHVEHLRERIRIDGAWVSESELLDAINSFLPVLEGYRSEAPDAFPTFFELMTALAMECFRSRDVDWGIFEVGLGGRLDATNVVAPKFSAITSIGLEHTPVLGNSLREIAREKAGIIKERVPVVLGELPEEARDEILAEARRRNAEAIPARAVAVRREGPGHVAIEGWPGRFAAPAVHGPALRADLAVALLLHRLVLQEERREPSPERLAAALADLELPARVEYFPGTTPVVLDGAHTAESFAALRETLEEIGFPRPRVAVFSLASDKQADAILRELRAIADSFIFTRADPLRSFEPADLRERIGDGDVVEEPREALARARAQGRAIVVCGSIYLAGDLRREIRGV